MMDAENEQYVRLHAERFVQHLRKGCSVQPRQPPRAEWLHAARGLPAVSIISERAGQFGICVAAQSIVEAAFAPPLAAQILATAFGLLKGRPARFLEYADAAVLDWAWRNSSGGTISGQSITQQAPAIAGRYSLKDFDALAARGSIEMLERNGSLIDWGSDTFHLAEKVTIWR